MYTFKCIWPDLHQLARAGKDVELERWLDKGADVNKRDAQGWTLLVQLLAIEPPDEGSNVRSRPGLTMHLDGVSNCSVLSNLCL